MSYNCVTSNPLFKNLILPVDQDVLQQPNAARGALSGLAATPTQDKMPEVKTLREIIEEAKEGNNKGIEKSKSSRKKWALHGAIVLTMMVATKVLTSLGLLSFSGLPVAVPIILTALGPLGILLSLYKGYTNTRNIKKLNKENTTYEDILKNNFFNKNLNTQYRVKQENKELLQEVRKLHKHSTALDEAQEIQDEDDRKARKAEANQGIDKALEAMKAFKADAEKSTR